jgi:uncharacterized protein (TIGR02145 family)/prepilin-type N-terminal cleavage/methylation domain-containing protein
MKVHARRAFTLIELLVVIAIIAILAVVVVLVLNPAALLQQARDSSRLSDMQTITGAINLYNEDQGGATGYSLGTPGVIYLSIPDPTATTTAGNNCSGLGLPAASTTYHCAASSTYRKTNGTGWIPMNFANITISPPLSALPVDPTNTTSSGEYYKYTTDGINFEIAGIPESQKYSSQPANFAAGSSRTLITLGSGGSSFTCGSPLVDARDSQSYTTVQIGTQCWMQQNLNVGTMVLGATNQGTSVSSAASIQKYCYSDNSANCTTYGGLYQWTQTVGGSAGCDGTGAGQPACTTPIQGICPASWHIPSHYEWTQLELTTCTSGTCSTDFPYDETTQGWQGTNEGTTLQSPTGLFRGLLAGDRTTGGSFFYQGSYALFWSSLASGGSAWFRYLYSGGATVFRYADGQADGLSVRCVHN